MKNSILFKIWKFPQLSETFILTQIITAINCGYEVKILVKDLLDFNENSSQLSLLERYKIKEKILLDDPKIPGHKIRRFIIAIHLVIINLGDLIKLFRFLNNEKFISISGIFRFHHYKKMNKFDIIHVQYGTNIYPLDLLKKLNVLTPKLIVSFHGHDAFFPINGIIKNNGYYDNLFQSAELIIANTRYLKDKILELGCPKAKIISIPVGVNIEYFRPIKKKVLNPDSIKLIMVGRLDKIKGHHIAIEVVSKLRKLKLPVVLNIIGEGQERINIEKLIQIHELEESVFLMGSKNQNEILNLFRDHDIYILPSIKLPNGRAETQGLAALEAQACGIPAVVFNSGGVKYTVRNNETGFVISEDKLNAMIFKIKELIENPELYQSMSFQARSFVKKDYSQKKIELIWCETYKNLINGR